MLSDPDTQSLQLRNWTPSQRHEQSARCRAQKIWLKSTGPKTIEGKKRSSRNALKHGHRSAIRQKFKKLLRLQRQFLKKFKAHERIQRLKRRMVLEMLKKGITRENFSQIYERTDSLGRFSGLQDKTSDYVNNIYAQQAKVY